MATRDLEPADVMMPSDVGADDSGSVDGRTTRRERNRSAVINSALALYDADRYPFTIHELSEHSGVSVRSIYRYFTSLDDLVHTAAAARLESLTALVEVFEADGVPLADRIQRFLRSRLALLTRVQPFRGLGDAMGPSTDPGVLRIQVEVRERMRSQFVSAFRPELDAMSDDRRLHVTFAVETMMLPAAVVFRREQLGMTQEASLVLLADVLEILLTATGGPDDKT